MGVDSTGRPEGTVTRLQTIPRRTVARRRTPIGVNLAMLVIGPVLFTAILGTVALTAVWYEIASLFDE